MENKMEDTMLGYIGTTIGIHVLVPSYPKARLHNAKAQTVRAYIVIELYKVTERCYKVIKA